jgi:serine/threonine protein kinase
MPISSGTKLGSFEITGAIGAIGAGGMGEVYQAHDTKLGRDVAIKVLPEAFVHDPERLARFQREAKMLAALNHPNIATIHGLEQSGSTSYLVMELVSGETLQERVKREGSVPIEEGLTIARQIAEALEAAHENNIIHRDLKPANVKVTPQGRVKVLDFGLAKAFEGDTATEDNSNSPTLSAAATMQGLILGTAAYMSPEQARGKSVDKRTDIWAFGCVVFELFTGKRAFHGDSTTEILATVLKEEPDWQALPETTPQSIQALLRRCIQKDVNKRWRDAGDVRIEIEETLAAPATLTAISSSPGEKVKRQYLPWASGLVLSVIVGVAIWNLKPAPSGGQQPVTRTVINLPPGQQLAGLENGPAVALSPDGTQLVYVALQGGIQRLYLRAMNNLEARPVLGTEGAIEPFFSPDSQWLGFFAGRKLKKVSLSGGTALSLGDAPSPNGASWGNQGNIAFAPINVGAIQQVSDAGGATQPLSRIEKKGENTHRWPEFLSGGKVLLFAAGMTNTNWTQAQVSVRSAGGGELRNLLQGA